MKRPHNEMDNDTTLSATTTNSSSSRASGSSSSSSHAGNSSSNNSTGIDELSTTKKKRPKVATTSNHIFTRISFSELPLDTRLATHLEKSILDGGMGLLSSTRIQRSVQYSNSPILQYCIWFIYAIRSNREQIHTKTPSTLFYYTLHIL